MTIDQNEFEGLLEQLLRRVYPDFNGLHSCARLTGGANQETYKITFTTTAGEQTCALRRAAGGQQQLSDENIGLNHEAELLKIVAQYDVPVPEVIAKLNDEDGLGDGFLMPWLNGETRGARIARNDKFLELRKTLAYQCGATLAKIHSIDIDKHKLSEFLPTRTPGSFVEATWARYKALDSAQPMLDYTARWLLSNLPKTTRTTLVHNDFRNGNLMVDEHHIVAVLDWEVAHIGDPYRDLGWICTKSWCFGGELPVGGFGLQEDLFNGYTSVSGHVVKLGDVKFWEVFGSFWWGVGCLLMADQYRSGPDPSVERPAIGRRSSECQMDCANLIIPGEVHHPPIKPKAVDQLASSDELLKSVSEFLRDDVMSETEGRVNFLARVAANSIDIVRREHGSAEKSNDVEHNRLCRLIGDLPPLDDKRELGGVELRWRLVEAIRNDKLDLSNPELQDYLRQSVYNQLSIDQPTYPGLARAASYEN